MGSTHVKLETLLCHPDSQWRCPFPSEKQSPTHLNSKPSAAPGFIHNFHVGIAIQMLSSVKGLDNYFANLQKEESFLYFILCVCSLYFMKCFTKNLCSIKVYWLSKQCKKIVRWSVSLMKIMEMIPGAQGSRNNSVRQQVKHMVITADKQ